MWQNRYNLAFALLAMCGVLLASFFPVCWAAEPTSPPDSNALLAQAAAGLLALPALDAEFRFRVHLLGEVLPGTGHYRQANHGGEPLFRLDLRTQLEDSVVTQQIIGNAEYLWIRREGTLQPQPVVRIDWKQIRRLARQRYGGVPPSASPALLSLVALPKQLTSLQAWYAFTPPQEVSAAGRSVYVLTGQLRAELLQSQLQTTNPAVDQIPNVVRVTLGRDPALPLFPYRIEYLKQHGRELDPLLVLDYYSIQLQPELDPHLFEYLPGDQEVEDQTGPYLQRLGLR
jgi:hypothetical protein